ncbi:MAG: inositol monophosphatase family protein [Actinomycetota bacterium]
MDDPDLDELVDELTPVIRAASRRSLEWFRRPIEVASKLAEGFDPVTEADRAVEDELRAHLTARFPDHRIVGEERGTTGSGELSWIIDPIDGTRAFVSGIPLFGTLVCLRDGDDPLLGWMHLPVLDETYVGRAGRAWMDGPAGRRELATRRTAALAEATVCCTHPDMFTEADEVAAFERVAAACRMTRFGGDCANYGFLALGFVDAVVETDLAPYDIAALVPIVEGAGGVVTSRDGGSPGDGGFVVASAHAALHEELLAIVAP